MYIATLDTDTSVRTVNRTNFVRLVLARQDRAVAFQHSQHLDRQTTADRAVSTAATRFDNPNNRTTGALPRVQGDGNLHRLTALFPRLHTENGLRKLHSLVHQRKGVRVGQLSHMSEHIRNIALGRSLLAILHQQVHNELQEGILPGRKRVQGIGKGLCRGYR